MSYVDALYSKDTDTVHVVERSTNGQRVYKQYPAVYQFFYPDSKGKYLSIHREPLSKVKCKTHKDFRKELSIYSNKKLYESDLNQTFICLSENYLHCDPPKLNIAFFDIETDFSAYSYSGQHIVKIRKKSDSV